MKPNSLIIRFAMSKWLEVFTLTTYGYTAVSSIISQRYIYLALYSTLLTIIYIFVTFRLRDANKHLVDTLKDISDHMRHMALDISREVIHGEGLITDEDIELIAQKMVANKTVTIAFLERYKKKRYHNCY